MISKNLHRRPTNHWTVDIELWPKEAPKAVRNFVQLWLEGYYDHVIFHRVIKSFLVRTGDPSGTGTDLSLPFIYLTLQKPTTLMDIMQK